MRLAIEEINNSADLLPNHTLGYRIFDSCATPVTAQRAVLAVLNGQDVAESSMCSGGGPMLAIVGESGSSQSIVVSRTLQPFRIPMISYFSTCSCLSDRKQFPTFFRVVPSDDYQVKAIAQLLKKFGWRWVGVVTEDHDYGRFALQGLKREIENTDICLAYHEMIPKDFRQERVLEILNVMRKSTARVVVVFSGEGEFYPFLREFLNQNITGIQWIASEAWVTASILAETYPFLAGTIGFAVRQGYVPGLKEYLTTVSPQRYPSNPLVKELWEALYGCSPFSSSTSTQLPLCTGQETLSKQHSAYMNTSSPRVTYNVYKAVYAIAHSLHNLFQCVPGYGLFNESSCADINDIHPWQLQHYLQEVSFSVSGERVNFDARGDSIPSYDLINWQRQANGDIDFVKVGLYDGARDAGRELLIQDQAVVWPGNQSKASVRSQSVRMTLPLLWLLVLHISKASDPHCTLQNDFEPGFMAGGDFVIGGIFPLHYNQEMPDLNCTYKPGQVQCNGFDPRAFRWAVTMKLAVEEINNSTELLPNHTLGYKIFDSCAYPLTGQRAALAVMNGPNEADRPMCPGASPMLAIIGVVRGDHEYGRSALQGLLKELEGTGVCVAYQEMIPLLYDSQRAVEIFRVMNSSSARVVVVFSAEGELTPFLRDYMELNVTGIQWIASEAWVTAAVFTGSKYYPFLGGTIGFGIRQGYIPQLREYLTTVNPQRYPTNPLVQELWGALYGCSPFSSNNGAQLPLCTGHETISKQHSAYMNTSSPRIAYNVYKGVYAIAHSLHNLISCNPGNGPFNNSTCADITKVFPWQLQHYLQEVSFTISGEMVNFDTKGDSIPSYDLINWQKGTEGNIELVKVGMFDGAREPGKELVIYEMPITWSGDQTEASCSQNVVQYMRCLLLKFCRVKWR
ncbi:hypothetical protein AOLI_G00101120 [Acnodon oligacanthus]